MDVVNRATTAAHFAFAQASTYQGSKFAPIRLAEFVVAEHADKGLSLHPGL